MVGTKIQWAYLIDTLINDESISDDELEDALKEAIDIATKVGDLIEEDTSFEIGDLNPNHKRGENAPSLKKGDVSIDSYLLDDNNAYCNNNSGVEIDGFLFFPESVKADESYARREYKRTKIMSGGEFVTRGQFMPREFSFTTVLDIDPNQPFMYDKIFEIMENKPCEVVSPYMGDNFKAEIQIDKTHPKSSPSNLKLDIKVKEIVTPKTTVVGDAVLEYPSTTTLSDKAINIKAVQKDKKEDKKKKEREQITYDLKAKDKTGQEFDNPYD